MNHVQQQQQQQLLQQQPVNETQVSAGDDDMTSSWQSIILSDSALWTHITLPVYIDGKEFVSLVTKTAGYTEVLDCSSCTQLTQDAFLTLARSPVVVFPHLRRIHMPTELTVANAVYESLASAGCWPKLEQIANIQAGKPDICNPLKCQAYFKQSRLKVLTDTPMTSYGRVRHLLVPDSTEVKHRRQRWDSDLAKAAISCPTVDTYRCIRGAGYVDDKSLERLSVLFPKLRAVELRQCSITDDGLVKFLAHNKRSKSAGSDLGLTKLILDRPGDVSDTSLRALADNCSCLSHVTLARCDRVTGVGIGYLLSRCKQLAELCLSNIDVTDVTLMAVSGTCRFLTSVQLYNVTSAVTSRGLVELLRHAGNRLSNLTLRQCHNVDASCLDAIGQYCSLQLESLSLDVAGHQTSIQPSTVVRLVMRCKQLSSFFFEAHSQFQLKDLPQLAEETFNLLNDDVTCRSSLMTTLVLSNVDSNFTQLMAILCSHLTSFQLRQPQSCENWSQTLSELVSVCQLLQTVDISAVSSCHLDDEFFLSVCQHCLRLRHMSVTLNPLHVGRETLSAVLQTLPSLTSLDVVVHCDNVTTYGDESSSLDQYLLSLVQCQCAKRSRDPTCGHSRLCYYRVYNRPTGSGSKNSKQFQLVFTARKFASVGSLITSS